MKKIQCTASITIKYVDNMSINISPYPSIYSMRAYNKYYPEKYNIFRKITSCLYMKWNRGHYVSSVNFSNNIRLWNEATCIAWHRPKWKYNIVSDYNDIFLINVSVKSYDKSHACDNNYFCVEMKIRYVLIWRKLEIMIMKVGNNLCATI